MVMLMYDKNNKDKRFQNVWFTLSLVSNVVMILILVFMLKNPDWLKVESDGNFEDLDVQQSEMEADLAKAASKKLEAEANYKLEEARQARLQASMKKAYNKASADSLQRVASRSKSIKNK